MGAVGRLLAAARAEAHLPPPELRRLIEQESEALVASRRRAAASIAIQLRERLEGALVVTHSASATVREAVLHTPPKNLLCTVSYPVEEGRAFADELRASGLAVELVEDEEAPMELAGASLLLVGADTVFRDGTLCNKIGTRALAETAAEHEVPTIVACEVIKLAPIESTEAGELPREVRELFDLTPPELVHAVVTEEGTVGSDEVHALVDRTPSCERATRCSDELPEATLVPQTRWAPMPLHSLRYQRQPPNSRELSRRSVSRRRRARRRRRHHG